MSSGRKWAGAHVAKARAYCQRHYGWTCWLCGHEIAADDYTVDHVIERRVAPHLTFDPTNWRPAHGRKHPELGCPGNKGRSGRTTPMEALPREWTAPGW